MESKALQKEIASTSQRLEEMIATRDESHTKLKILQDRFVEGKVKVEDVTAEQMNFDTLSNSVSSLELRKEGLQSKLDAALDLEAKAQMLGELKAFADEAWKHATDFDGLRVEFGKVAAEWQARLAEAAYAALDTRIAFRSRRELAESKWNGLNVSAEMEKLGVSNAARVFVGNSQHFSPSETEAPETVLFVENLNLRNRIQNERQASKRASEAARRHW